MRIRTASRLSLTAAALSSAATLAVAHPTGSGTNAVPVTPLKFEVETRGPVAAPAPTKLAPGTPVSGQGFWTFTPVRGSMPVPPDALPFLKGAHGTIIVDAPRDVVYWGLEKVGWVGFSNNLTQSWIVKGDPAFSVGNLHGADILPRPGQTPLVAAADNVRGQVYLTDTTFQHAESLGIPNLPEYADKKGYAPTDVAFTDADHLWITDGYGKAFFMPATTQPLKFEGKAFGGKKFSGTPHGITYDPRDKSLLVSARPEGQIKRWDLAHEHLDDIEGLPAGNTVCDVDVWGDYALASCLDGPSGTPGPLFVVNLKKRTLVSTIRPKADLGYVFADHMHDATWYVRGTGANREVYILFTHWNPGGIAALKLVNVAGK